MIGLIDCNNFFVSCERLFRPDLRQKPVLVLSSNDGCVVARSQEVKDLGVPMGIPYFEIKDMCKKADITIFSSNFKLYRDISARVMTTIQEEFESCEVYSVDEAFCALEDTITEKELSCIRDRIMQKTGIPVSIGVATTKTLAKVANGVAKKRRSGVGQSVGVCVLKSEEWLTLQQEVLCGSVWGLGRQTSALLAQHKIYTVADFLRQDKAFVRQLLGVVGERLFYELTEVSVYALGDSLVPDQESYTSSRSFGKPVFERLHLMSALGHHVAHVSEKLRSDRKVATQMIITIRGSRFGSFAGRKGTAQSIFTMPTNDLITLTKEASRLLNELYDPEIPYKKAGVSMYGILGQEYTSGSLFSIPEHPEVSAITDTLNQRFGSGSLRTGVTMSTNAWKEKRQNISKEYTTNWSDIPVVKAK